MSAAAAGAQAGVPWPASLRTTMYAKPKEPDAPDCVSALDVNSDTSLSALTLKVYYQNVTDRERRSAAEVEADRAKRRTKINQQV
jgi:hypothetical protein